MALKPLKKLPSQSRKKLLNNLILTAILVMAVIVRFYKIDTPLADWHSWRQVDTVSVAREFTKHGIDLLHPRYLDLSDIPSGKDNPEGYRMVEFPFVSAKIAWLYQSLGITTPLHIFYRYFSIGYSVGSIIMLYALVRLIAGRRLALITAAIFAFLPYNIYYSRVTLPEIPLVFYSLFAMYALAKFFTGKDHSLKNPWYWLAVVTLGAALLIKPTALFFAVPMLAIGWRKCGLKLITSAKTYVFVILAFLPLLAWRWWITLFPAGVPAYEWLLNGNGIRFKGAFFRWIFADRIGRLILGYWGLPLLSFGLLESSLFFGLWLLSMLAYLTIFATGNVQHDYYQIITMPIIAIYVAKGIEFLLRQKTASAKALLVVSGGFMLAFGWYEVRGYYNINNPSIVEAGQAVDSLAAEDALIIAPYMGDTAFLYQTNRRGWPIGGQVSKRIDQGADYYVSTALDDETKLLMSSYEVVRQTEGYVIINLHEPARPSQDAPVNAQSEPKNSAK